MAFVEAVSPQVLKSYLSEQLANGISQVNGTCKDSIGANGNAAGNCDSIGT